MRFKDLDIATKVILQAVLAGLVLVFLWEIREILIILLLALILASAMDPLVSYLKQHKVPRTASVLAVYILVLGLAGLLVYTVIPLVAEQTRTLLAALPDRLAEFQNHFGNYLGASSVTDLFQNLSGAFTGESVVSRTFGIFSGVIFVISILVIAFYLVAEPKGMRRFISLLVPSAHHEFSESLLEKVQKRMGLWILGQFIASVVMFLITWGGLALLHIQNAFILAVIAGVLEVVPYIGPIISAIPAMFFGIIQGGFPLALGVGILYFLLHELEGYVLIPKIMEKTVGGSPLMILLAVLVGYKLAGPVGIVIAVPLVGALNVIVQEFWPDKSAA